ncbi:MAG TPA: hypothetical protein EYG73_12850 [Arcobacter sp.]|nr:hypothetical protein [Arcobacter sp.]
MGRRIRNKKNKIKKKDKVLVAKKNIELIETGNIKKESVQIDKKITIDKLENKIENLLKYFDKYPNEKSTNDIKKITKDLNNQEYKIAVVANMSSGKSTFINALFGKEVLPAFNHATTDSATFVYSEPNVEKRAIIYFNDGKKEVEIKDDLEKEIKQYAQKDEECKDDKYKNVEKIELFYPFKNLQTSSSKDFKITFIDTPGPNSTGDGYKQKHKDQTRSVLNEVDLALFMFDYTQLDANLESDEQGLWNTIKKRHDKDKNFDVYFILNKIDCALEDNFKEVEDANEAKKQWFVHENLAIEKLKKAGIKHEIDNPKIYPISSMYQLLHRNDIKWKSPLKAFKENFTDLFGDMKGEEKFIEYIGISKLEKDINSYIDSSVKGKILKKISSQLYSMENDESEKLETIIQILEKPKEEAEENLQKAENFLMGRAKEMQKEMKVKSSQIEKKYINKIEMVIDSAIESELTGNIDYMSKQTIAFAQAYALDGNIRLATKKSKINASKINLEDKKVKIDVRAKIDEQVVMKEMQKFMQTVFEDYKRNYLDSKSDIKEEYFEFERTSTQLIKKYQTELQEKLENSLNVKIEKIVIKDIAYNSILNIDIEVPNSVLDYQFDEHQETERKSRQIERSNWNPFKWFGDKYVTEYYDSSKTVTTHTFSISPKELKKSIENNMEESISKFSNIEKENHKKSIKAYHENNSGMFQEFRHNKIREMEKLKEEIQSSKDSLGTVKAQYNEFQDVKKGGK